jgi:glycine/D-amino acid oxidase-like deaminating enzyme
MIQLPSNETHNSPEPAYPKLTNDMETEVVIVGGGITGMTCTYLLKKAGLNVVVLEKHTLASSTTGGTTGKLTSQHGLLYVDLCKRFDETTANLYGEANAASILATLALILAAIALAVSIFAWDKANDAIGKAN